MSTSLNNCELGIKLFFELANRVKTRNVAKYPESCDYMIFEHSLLKLHFLNFKTMDLLIKNIQSILKVPVPILKKLCISQGVLQRTFL